MKLVMLSLVLLAAVGIAQAATKQYVKGTLTDVSIGQRTVGMPTPLGGTMIAQHDIFRISVKVDDVIYVAETRSKDVREFTVGDSVEVRIEPKDIYLKRSNGKELKAKLLTKTRSK